MACMSFLGCHSGLFSSARSSAAAKQPEKQQEDTGLGCGAVDEEQPLVEPSEAAEGAADESAPAKEVPAKAKGAIGRCLPAAGSRAGKPEGPPPAAAEAEGTPSTVAEADLGEPAPAEPEPAEGPAEPAHFDGSDPEDGTAGKAAKGCCVPRASRRRTRGTKKVKNDDQVEATPTVDSTKADGSPKVTGQGEASKTRASAGA